MRNRKTILTAMFASIAMAALILDARTAISGATEGLQLCMQTVIPSLFPFFVLSALLNAAITGQKIGLFSPFARFLGIPSGAESLLIVGLFGGYPVGAQGIAQAHRDKQLSDNDAKRMLAFCSNAGPAFVFGIGAGIFPEIWMCWLLWGIHILSALFVGFVTYRTQRHRANLTPAAPISLPGALRRSLITMSTVCGWVVLFRILIAFLDRWCLWLLSADMRLTLRGLLELANGCCGLSGFASIGLKFTLFAVFIGFGGLCVTMQTYSVAENVDIRMYLPGKLTQAATSLLLASAAQFLFSESDRWFPHVTVMVFCACICAIYRFLTKKIVKSSSIPALNGV